MFLSRIARRMKFELERLVLSGPIHRLFVIALAIIAISALAGYLAYAVAASRFEGAPDAIWWAFLRLTDPGYLGDDEGTLIRTISTVVTILGYVLFLGALIAIMTQWLNQTIERLHQGLTPIAQKKHILVLGWTNRTPTIIEELILSEGRMKRFLRRIGRRTLRIVVLVEDLQPDIVQDLKDRLGGMWNPRQIIFRSGSPLRVEHLDRVDFLNAAAIILSFPEFLRGSASERDERTMKILLSISAAARTRGVGSAPMVVAELVDGRKEALARRAYGGPIEILASDRLISRLIAQSVRHPGLSVAYAELLSHAEGNEIYVRECPELEGRDLASIHPAFSRGILLGLVRGRDFLSLTGAPSGVKVGKGDRLVVLAENYSSTAPDPVREWSLPASSTLPPLEVKSSRRVLLLGWNHKVPALLEEIAGYRSENFEIDIVSLASIGKRRTMIERNGVDLRRTRVRHVEADFTSLADLARQNPASWDNIVVVGSDRLDSEAESDARTILGFLVLEELLGKADPKPEILVELMDPANVPLLRSRADVLISP
jgi:ion channel POLLUX/CASTOR